jgi:hypothetical protein
LRLEARNARDERLLSERGEASREKPVEPVSELHQGCLAPLVAKLQLETTGRGARTVGEGDAAPVEQRRRDYAGLCN